MMVAKEAWFRYARIGMVRWFWRTRPDGIVEVNGAVPVLLDFPGKDKVLAKVLQWRALAEEMGKKHGVPPQWILGFILAESGGNPSAENFCCVGLMAVFWKVHGKRREDMLDPRKNVDYATSTIARTIKTAGFDLPRAASVHVGGGGTTGQPHASASNPWGLREHSWVERPDRDGSLGYIDRVVRASNTFAQLLGKSTATSVSTAGFSLPSWTWGAVAAALGFFGARRVLA